MFCRAAIDIFENDGQPVYKNVYQLMRSIQEHFDMELENIGQKTLVKPNQQIEDD